MTAGKIIAQVDNLEPNQYTTEQKLEWLSNFDGKVFEELIATHNDAAISSFSPHENEESELLIPFPYGWDVYTHYLQAMIAVENAEDGKYNQQIMLTSIAYQSYTDMYNRTHTPIGPVGGNRFRF